MDLVIVSTRQKNEYKNVQWLELETTTGNIVICPRHAPTVLLITPQSTINFCLETDAKEMVQAPAGGIAQITRSGVMVMLKE